MDKLELAIATDYSGETSRTEDLEHILKMISQAGFTHIHWCHEWDGDYTYSIYEMQQIREWMDKYNLKAKSLHATIGTVSYTHLDVYKRQVMIFSGSLDLPSIPARTSREITIPYDLSLIQPVPGAEYLSLIHI